MGAEGRSKNPLGHFETEPAVLLPPDGSNTELRPLPGVEGQTVQGFFGIASPAAVGIIRHLSGILNPA